MAAGIAVFAALSMSGARSEDAPHGTSVLSCTNNSSGFNWKMKVDYDHSTVDAFPAKISATEMSWHTPGGENYKLDRKTGNLTVIVASSTGGSFLYDRCKQED
jgi:hypothetical protein